MPAKILVGTQWGDEGKGKISDVESASADAVVRYQGGNNTGKTVENERGRFVLHIVPTGIFHGKICIIERGVVIHPPSFVAEMEALEKLGLRLDNLMISPFAHLVMPWHIVKDLGKEGSLTEGTKIGTTGRGIGPCYQDKMGRSQAIRVADLRDKQHFLERLEAVYKSKSAKLSHYFSFPPLDEVRAMYLQARERILPYVFDTGKVIQGLLGRRKTILLEGAQAIRLDVDHGTYPFVTSSSTGSIAALMYTGVPPEEVTSVVGVVKAYDTRVGKGAFPTEYGGKRSEEWCNDPDHTKAVEDWLDVEPMLFDEFFRGVELRRVGNEYGASTGRPRRCGRLDLPLLRYSVKAIHATELALTKLDILGKMGVIEVCTGYKGVREIGAFEFLDLHLQEPIYETIETSSLDGIESRNDLPVWAQKVVDMIEQCTSTPVTFISTGPERNQYLR